MERAQRWQAGKEIYLRMKSDGFELPSTLTIGGSIHPLRAARIGDEAEAAQVAAALRAHGLSQADSLATDLPADQFFSVTAGENTYIFLQESTLAQTLQAAPSKLLARTPTGGVVLSEYKTQF